MELGGGVTLARLNCMVDAFRSQLESVGSVCAESGELTWPRGRLSIHTDFGPPDQDKDTNQDFVVAWVAKDESASVECAIAVADGVTSSFQAEAGARVACWTGLSRLVKELVNGKDDFEAMCQKSMDAAGDAIGVLADELVADAERFRPPWEYVATWKYTLREGLLLQTTLTLAWVKDDLLSVALVGDGGVTVLPSTGDAAAGKTAVRVLGGADPETNRVHALGPLNRHVSAFDFCDCVRLTGSEMVAIFTDGVGRGIAEDKQGLLARRLLQPAAGENSLEARQVIEDLMADCPKDFEDNLTLALIVRD